MRSEIFLFLFFMFTIKGTTSFLHRLFEVCLQVAIE